MYPSAYMSYSTHFPPNNDPRAREIPYHMKMDHQPWPCYPVPHGCCNHGCFGGGGGPYTVPHYPPPQPIFHANGFHPFSGAYSIPPPHYSVEQPRYDYDKNNHVPHPKADTKTSECESLVPLFLKDSPYPIMWVPSPGNSNSDNDKKPRKEPEVVDKKSDESLAPLFLKDSSYPIMWVPPGLYMNQDSKHSHVPVAFKDAEEPIKPGENGERKHLPFPIFWLPSKDNEVANDTKDNNLDLSTQKRLPDENRTQGHDSDSETRNKHVRKVIPVKQIEEKQEKKSLETKMESKLPPVCLRIEPLPRKKKTSSRSPSPPGEKDRSKSSQQETHLPENLSGHSGFADSRENRKVDEKRKLSENEAALMIQSAYRGFEVRKSQPLMKLRQIGEVAKQGVEIRSRIQDMESLSSAVGIDEKWKLTVGETIMSLLLKLDTIQGLHPIVRDIRKSVAKELVGLQEKLDSLTSIKSETTGQFKDDAINEKIEKSDNNVPLVESGSKDSHDDSGLEACNTNIELRKEEGIVGDDVIQHKFDKAVTEFNSTNEAIGSVKNNIEEHNSDKHVETEQRLDDSIQEKSDKMEADKTMESVTDTCEKQEAKNAESDVDAIKAGDISFEQHDESESQQSLIIPETEQTVKQEKPDVSMVEMNVELPTEEASKAHDFQTEIVMKDLGGNLAASRVVKKLEGVEPANGGDRKLMEENGKFRLAVEELLNQQASVIKELKRKVQDLEKKLSKKNKKTKVNKCKSRGFVSSRYVI